MRRILWIPLCIAALLLVPVAVLASSGDHSFPHVVSAIEQKYHTHATRIPMMGLVSFVARRATHGGVSGLQVADFEHFDAAVDGAELEALVRQELGPGWERMIRETNREGGDQTLIYVRPEGNRMGMFVVDLDGSEMNVVQI